MQVLLNATAREAARFGGDPALYRSWARLSGGGVVFRHLPDALSRRAVALARRGMGRLVLRGLPDGLRARLYAGAMQLPLRAAEAEGVDAVFSHLQFPWFIGETPAPVVWHSMGLSPPGYYEYVNGAQFTHADVVAMYRALGPRADALAVATRGGAEALARRCPELRGRLHVTPAPVFVDAPPRPKPSESGEPLRFLFAGRDALRKGLAEMVAAFEGLPFRGAPWELQVVSLPPPDLAARLRALQGARLVPTSDAVDVGSLMAAADVFLVPTHADTYALAAAEAMAHGCAVVISDLDPLPDVVPDKEAGLVVPRQDPVALRDAVQLLRDDLDLLRRLQAGARARHASVHAPGVVRANLRAVVEAAAARWGGRPGSALP